MKTSFVVASSISYQATIRHRIYPQTIINHISNEKKKFTIRRQKTYLKILISHFFFSFVPYLSPVVFDVRFTQISTIEGTFLRKHQPQPLQCNRNSSLSSIKIFLINIIKNLIDQLYDGPVYRAIPPLCSFLWPQFAKICRLICSQIGPWDVFLVRHAQSPGISFRLTKSASRRECT